MSWRIPQDRYYSTIDAFPRPDEMRRQVEKQASDWGLSARTDAAAVPPTVPWRAGAATLFLGAQLAFDPSQNVSALAREYPLRTIHMRYIHRCLHANSTYKCHIYIIRSSYGSEVFGEANADAVAEALLATEDAWLNRYGLPTKLAPIGAYQDVSVPDV